MVEDCRVPCITSFGKGFFEFSPAMERSAWLLLSSGFIFIAVCGYLRPMRWARPRGMSSPWDWGCW
jgi:hypothetical protein